MATTPHPRLMVITIGVVGTVAVVEYALLAILQILVFNPLAAVPGAGLTQIGEDLAAANETLSAPFVLAFLMLGPMLALTLLLVAIFHARSPPIAVLIAYLILLVLGTPAYFIASFGAGMALADTYGIGGEDHALWALPLYWASIIAMLCIAVVLVVPATRRRLVQPSPSV